MFATKNVLARLSAPPLFLSEIYHRQTIAQEVGAERSRFARKVMEKQIFVPCGSCAYR